MLDAAGIAHARSTDDDLGHRVLVNGLRFLCRNRELQVGECNRVDPLCKEIQSLLIIALASALIEDLRCVDSERAVHIDREAGEIRNQIFLLDLPDIIQDDLRPAYCESRDHHISSPVEGLRNNFCQILDNVNVIFLMDPVSIGGLHDHIIRLFRQLGILEERLALIAKVSAEADAFAGAEYFVIGVADEEFDRLHGVFHGIDGLIALSVHFSLCLLVSPLRLHRLDVRRVTEHNIAEARRRFRGKDLSSEAVVIELGQHTRMVDMRVRQEHEVDLRSGDRKFCILVTVYALLHTAVYQEFLLAHLQIVTAARHFVIRADKH